LPSNSIIYKGTDGSRTTGNYRFFGSKKIAKGYANLQGGDVHSYKTKVDLKLLDMNNFSNIENLYELATSQEEHDLISLYFMNLDKIEKLSNKRVTFKDGRSMALHGTDCELPPDFSRAICTEGFITRKDESNEMYISRKMLRFICRATLLDGWIHFGIMARSRARGGPFHDEIGICHPQEDLEWKGVKHTQLT
jgi:hypothetical protein